MTRPLVVLLLLAGFTTVGTAQTNYPSLYITPTEDSFEVYLTAAMHKKQVPVTVLGGRVKTGHFLTGDRDE